MNRRWTRRATLVGGAVAGTAVIVSRARAADFKFVQYHNQSAGGTLHKNLVAMWNAISDETGGRVEATVHPENNRLAAGDPGALKMLLAGEIQFFTLMGGIIGTVVPMAEIQQAPFAFSPPRRRLTRRSMVRSATTWREEMAAKGMHLFPVAGFDNGMRQVTTVAHPIVQPDDLAGVKIRVPPGQMIFDTFQAFGAEPITTPANLIYDAIKSGKVGAQENPLAILEKLQLYEVVKYVSMTNHMWSGFNEMAHLATWQACRMTSRRRSPATSPNSSACSASNKVTSMRGLQGRLKAAGLVFNDVDQAPFRARLARSMRPGKTSLAARLGACWRMRSAVWGEVPGKQIRGRFDP